MKKREILIAAIIVLSLAGCRAEKDNISSVAVNTESSITETVSDISETPADASSNKTAEITEKPESSAPKRKPTGGVLSKRMRPTATRNITGMTKRPLKRRRAIPVFWICC